MRLDSRKLPEGSGVLKTGVASTGLQHVQTWRDTLQPMVWGNVKRYWKPALALGEGAWHHDTIGT